MQDQLRVLTMMDQHAAHLSFALEDVEPFKVEPMRVDPKPNQPIFTPPHKLRQVELDFSEAQWKKLEGLDFI